MDASVCATHPQCSHKPGQGGLGGLGHLLKKAQVRETSFCPAGGAVRTLCTALKQLLNTSVPEKNPKCRESTATLRVLPFFVGCGDNNLSGAVLMVDEIPTNT